MEPCEDGKRGRLERRPDGRTVLKGFPQDATPVIEVIDKEPELSPEARDYLTFIDKTYQEWISEEALSIIQAWENTLVNSWVKRYDREDPRLHWIKQRVMAYFSIKTPQTFLQLLYRSKEKYLRKILHFIRRPIKKENLNENLWFFVTKQSINVKTLADVSWKIENKSLNSNSEESSIKSLKSKSKKKKKDNQTQVQKYIVCNAQIPIVYNKVLSQIHLHCARRPLGQIIKVNFLGFSRIPVKKYIPKFELIECESEMNKYVKEMNIGRITKPDERVFVHQCLENRPRIRQFDSILKDSISQYERNNLVKSYLKVDFRIQWLKEKLLNFFEIENPKEFYKMCTRHGGLSRNKILEFINTKYDPTDEESFNQVMFVYASKYTRTYYKFVKFNLEKEELERFVEPQLTDNETGALEGDKISTGAPTSITATTTTTTKTRDDNTSKDGPKKKPKKKPRERTPKPKKKKKKMKLVRVKYEAAIPVKYKKEVVQLHLHHGPLTSVDRSWRDKHKVLCLMRKNNPFQYIPHFDSYEEALAEMPKYVLIQSFEMDGLLQHLYSTAELCRKFLNKQIGEPLFPSVINKNNGASICLPGTIAKREFLVQTHLNKIPFPWNYITNGPVIFQEYLYEKRCWPGTCDTNISVDSKEQSDIYKAVETRKDINYSNKLRHNSSNRFLCSRWLNSFNHIYDFYHMVSKERETFIKSKVEDSSMTYALAIGKSTKEVKRMHVFSKVKKLLKIKSIPANVELVPDDIPIVEDLPIEPLFERINMTIFDPKKFKQTEVENRQKMYRNFNRLPQEYITKVKSKIVEKNTYINDNPFKMQIIKRERLKFPQIKTNLKSLKLFVKRLHKNSQYPNKLCVPHWREMLEKYIKEYEGLQKATEAIFSQKEYTKKDIEFRTILFQYLRKLYWFCREKMPRSYGPFTLYRYWKLRELVTFPFIRQCFGSHTIKFMLTHYYYNDKYYFDQFNKQIPFLIKVHKRAKYYCHMLKGFIIMLKNFRLCNSVDELSSIVCRFWGYLRNYWTTSHFLSYQEIFCWALSYVNKTLLGKIKAMIKVDYLLSIPLSEAQKSLLEVLFLMKLWKDEFNKSFSLCINDKGGYQQVLVLLEDDFFQSTVNITKICGDLLKLLKRLMYFTNVFNADLALSVTEPQIVYYWRKRCIESVQKITDYDIFDLENDKKWDHLQMEWHKNYKKMERQSMRLLKDLSKKIRDPSLIAHCVNKLSPKETSKKIYSYSLRMLENCIDKIMDDMKDRFVMYLKDGNSLHDYFAHRNGPVPIGGIMWMQKYVWVFLHQLKSVICGDKILEVIQLYKDIGTKLRIALKEFKDFVSAIELIAYTQEIYIRDFVILRSVTGSSVRIKCKDPGPLRNYYMENKQTCRFNLSYSRHETSEVKTDPYQALPSFRTDRKTFQFIDNKMYVVDKARYNDNNPPEVKIFFFNIEHKKHQVQENQIRSFNRFLEGIFNNIKTFQNVKEKRINLNYRVWHMFLKKGRLASTFIPINSIKKYASPFTVFEIDLKGKYLYINSPHGELNKVSSMIILPKRNYSVEESLNTTKYKYKKIISDNVLNHFNINNTLTSRKHVRYDPEIVYTIIKNFTIHQNEELQHLIEKPTYEAIRCHSSFLLLVFLREMLSLEELNIYKNDLPYNFEYKENCDVDLDKTLTSDEEFILTTIIFTKMTQEQMGKLHEIVQKFEQIFLRESVMVKKIDSIVEVDLNDETIITNKFCDDSDSIPSNNNKLSRVENKSIERTSGSGIITSDDDYLSSNFYENLNIDAYQYYNSYFEDIENVEDDAFGVLIRLSNLIIFKDNDFINLKSYIGIRSETSDPTMGFQYNPICTTQDRRALPLRESADIEKDWDFLTNFIFENQGDIIRHFVLKPEEFNMRLYGKDLYSEIRDTHFLTNIVGQRDIYAYPIMMDKKVKKRVCKLSDRYYSEKKRVPYLSDSESEEISSEKIHRKVELVYEPVTGWGSDESIPGDYFPQRWIDMSLKDYVPYDPCGREAAQQMLLFKKVSSTTISSDQKGTVQEVEDKNVSIDDRKPLSSVWAKKDNIFKKEKIYEIHHNFNSKNKNVLFEPIDENFVCYTLNSSTSEIFFDGSKPALDGGHPTNKNQRTDINKIPSKRIGDWCNTLNYYNDNASLLPFVEKVPEWIPYQSQKQYDLISKLKRKSNRTLLTPPSSIQFSNECNLSKKTYKEEQIVGFPHPEAFPPWATHWPKAGEMSLNSKPALDKIARSSFLRQKFVDPEKIKLLNSFYKYYYYKAKKPFIPKQTHYENYLSRWKVHQYFPIQKKYRAIAQNYLKHFLKCPKLSTMYLDRLFSSHSLYLFRKYGSDNALGPILVNTLNQLRNGEKIRKIDKFLYGIYNVLPVNAKLEKLNHWFDTLQNEQADLLRPATSQLAGRLKNAIQVPGNIPFFIPIKYLHYFISTMKEEPLPLSEDERRSSDLVDTAKRLSEKAEDFDSINDFFKETRVPSFIKMEPQNLVENAISEWKNVLNDTPDEQLTVSNIERRLYDILQNTNYHKRCAFTIKLPSNFLEPYSQNRNMLHTLVSTDEDYRWRYDLEFTALTWKNLQETINAYNAFLQKLQSESEEDIYFMRSFLKQMDIRMLVVLRSYLLYKRIPMRSKRFIINGSQLFDDKLRQLREILNNVIKPAWDYIQNCRWFNGLEYDAPFQAYLELNQNVRGAVKSNLSYTNRLFYHNLKVLHYVLHGDWPPGFVNNFRFFKHFEYYELKRIEYSIRNLGKNTEFFKKTLLKNNVSIDSKEGFDSQIRKPSMEFNRNSILEEIESFLWYKGVDDKQGEAFVGKPILRIIYKYGDIRFYEPIEKWLFELWFQYINGYTNFTRWMAGTCENTSIINVISKNHSHSYSIFDEFMKYNEPKQYFIEGIKCIITFLNSINAYRKNWRVFYNLWSTMRRYQIRYSIIHEDLSMAEIDKTLRYITEVIKQLSEISLVPFGFIKIDLRKFIQNQMIPRCKKLKSAICYGVVKRIKMYMNVFSNSIYDLIKTGGNFLQFIQYLDNFSKAKALLRNFNIGVIYAQEATEVLAHSNVKFSSPFLIYIRLMEAILQIGRTRIQIWRLQKFYYQKHFEVFMEKFKAKCRKFVYKWWNEGPRNMENDLSSGLDLMSWYRKSFRDIRVKQKEYYIIEQKLNIYICSHYYFEHAFIDYRNQETLYAYYRLYQDYYKNWIKQYWQSFNLSDILSEFEPLKSSFEALDYLVKESPVGAKIYDMISKDYETLVIIKRLKDKTVKDRHWDSLIHHTQYDINLNDPYLKYIELFNWNLWKYSDFINELLLHARSEEYIFKRIKKLSYASVDCKLEILPYYDDGKLIGFILDSNDTTKRNIKKYIKGFKKLVESRFSSLFMHSLNSWIEILTFSFEVITDWLKVQKKWSKLKPLALAGDLEEELPDVAAIFGPIDKEYLKMTSILYKQRGVITQTMKRGIVKKFYQFSEALNECLASLLTYLETCENLVPIFQLISKDELYSIINEKSEEYP